MALCPVHPVLAIASYSQRMAIEKGSVVVVVGLLSKRLFSCLFGCGRTGPAQSWPDQSEARL